MASGGTWGKVHVLEGDGVVSHLFSYLFKMERGLRETQQYSQLKNDDGTPKNISIPIPDTVVYDRNFPQAWFTYSVKHGEMKRRAGKYLDAQQIYKGFCAVETGSGGICAQLCTSEENLEGGLPKIKVMYLSPSMLENCVYNRGNMSKLNKNGILQKFVPPRGSSNDCIQVIWSPKISLAQRRVNIHPIDSRHLDFYSRAATFDGAPHLSMESLASDRIRMPLVTMMNNVAEYLLKSEHKCISRFVALFKQDKDCQPFLLYATSIRIERDQFITSTLHRAPLELSTPYISPGTECTDEYIDEQCQRRVSMNASSSPGRKRVNTGELYKTFSPSAIVGSFRQKSKDPMSPRADTTVEETAPDIPCEVKIIEEFIDDTLYGLYAARMTASMAPKKMIVQVPATAVRFLGEELLQALMIGIFDMSPVHQGSEGGGSKRSSTASVPYASNEKCTKPLCTIRKEAKDFAEGIKEQAIAERS